VVGEGAHGVGHVHSGDGGGGGADGGWRAARQGGATRGPRGVPVNVKKHVIYFGSGSAKAKSSGSPDPVPTPLIRNNTSYRYRTGP
jgi:hypothetical protein